MTNLYQKICKEAFAEYSEVLSMLLLKNEASNKIILKNQARIIGRLEGGNINDLYEYFLFEAEAETLVAIKNLKRELILSEPNSDIPDYSDDAPDDNSHLNGMF
jgi:hypothetical protein